MNKAIRFRVVLAVAATISCALGFAQSPGEALYKAKCMSCHGPTGVADSGVGKIVRVKPVTDPEVKSLSEEEMTAMVRNGSGKMQAWKGELTEAQIKSTVVYFRSFLK